MDSRLRGNDGKRPDIAAVPGATPHTSSRGNDGKRPDIAAVVCGDSHTTTARE